MGAWDTDGSSDDFTFKAVNFNPNLGGEGGNFTPAPPPPPQLVLP